MSKHLQKWKTTVALVILNGVIAGFLVMRPAPANANDPLYARVCRCNIVDKACVYEDMGCQPSDRSTCSTTNCP